MRLATLTISNFRNLAGTFPFTGPITLIVGENNTGKSNLIDALRVISLPRSGPRFGRWITIDDFAHDSIGRRTADEFVIEAEFVELTTDERARMVTCLSSASGFASAKLRICAQLTAKNRVIVSWFGGDANQSPPEQWARETVVHTYLPPLRDAASDLRPGRDNRLVHLLSALAPEGSDERAEIEAAAVAANNNLDTAKAVTKAKDGIQQYLQQMIGVDFAQTSSLVFADPRFERIIGSLRALVGDRSPLELSENGLGYNNILYMATLMAAIESEPSDGLHLILIEEPEAHLHPQLQDLLMRFFRDKAQAAQQLMVTTHSPVFAAAAGVERMTILVQPNPGVPAVARNPAAFSITNTSLAHLGRFLDATKAALLFARGVILVEGIAEQLLMPAIAHSMHKSLSNRGIAVINVGGLAFGPFIDLFGPDRLPIPCAVVSDADPTMVDADEDAADCATRPLSATAQSLLARDGDGIRVFLSSRTLEWDLASAGNWDVLMKALAELKPRVAKRLLHDHVNSSPQQRADALLTVIRNVKGRFAQALADCLANGSTITAPSYISQTIDWMWEATDRVATRQPSSPAAQQRTL